MIEKLEIFPKILGIFIPPLPFNSPLRTKRRSQTIERNWNWRHLLHIFQSCSPVAKIWLVMNSYWSQSLVHGYNVSFHKKNWDNISFSHLFSDMPTLSLSCFGCCLVVVDRRRAFQCRIKTSCSLPSLVEYLWEPTSYAPSLLPSTCWLLWWTTHSIKSR